MRKTTKSSCFVSVIEKLKYERVIVKTRSWVRDEMCRDRAGAGGGERGEERQRELHSVKKIRSSGAHVEHGHTRDANKLNALIIIN